jgi:hypothetical protein
MRASDEGRERTVAELREGALDGCLSLDTFAFRVEAAYRARTVEDLAPLTADLPGSRWQRMRGWMGRLLQRRPARAVEVTVPDCTRTVTVGRSRTCDVVVGEETVSRVHAELRRLRSGEWRVRDLGSLNGTWLNGAPVREARVCRGDVLRLGALRMDLRL